MGDFNVISTTTTTDLDGVQDFSITPQDTDSPETGETNYINKDWTEQFGAYMEFPELYRSVTSLATWTAGLGFTTDNATQVILDNLIGWGEDTFTSIIMNMFKVMVIGGDAYAEIMKSDSGTIINLKVLNTGRMKIVVNEQGIIIRYEYLTPKKDKVEHEFKPEEIFHISNERIGDQIHGTSIVSVLKWIIEAKKEALEDWRRISHLSTIRVMYVDVDDAVGLAKINAQYAEGIKNKHVMLIPGKRGEKEFQDLTVPPIDAFMRWMDYLDSEFYRVSGTPKVMSTSENFTEAGSKVGFLTFEPVYVTRQTQLEKDIWNQLAWKGKFNRPPSLDKDLQKDEAKDGDLTPQPSDTTAGVGA